MNLDIAHPYLNFFKNNYFYVKALHTVSHSLTQHKNLHLHIIKFQRSFLPQRIGWFDLIISFVKAS